MRDLILSRENDASDHFFGTIEKRMIRHFLSVSFFTLLSRLTGFLRDVVLASLLGSSMFADAYFVAQRLPNHFRAIFGEGAFNSAFVPTYARTLSQSGIDSARLFAGRVMLLLVIVLAPFSIIAMWQMPYVVDLLAPGFSIAPEKYALTITLTRITFPYLFLISLVTLISGALNAENRFASAAAAPVLLNLAILAALGVAWFFPSAAHAAAWGILVSGVLQLALVGIDAWRHRCFPRLALPNATSEMARFFKALGPAVIGSAGVQIAIFADTIIASLLPTGSVSALSYADRLYQLPVGLIGIAAGTVLLPEMSKHLAGDKADQAHRAQNRSIGLTLALAAPFFVAFLMIPDVIMRGVFMRGQFTSADAEAAAQVLAAYGVGILPIVLIRSLVSSFHARSDTTTPLIAAFSGIAVNIALKLYLFRTAGAPGLAFATAIGAWVNGGLLILLAWQRKWIAPDSILFRSTLAVMGATAALAGATPFIAEPAFQLTHQIPVMRAVTELLALAMGGALVYGAVLAVLLIMVGVAPPLFKRGR